ncbi:hypothetical protein INT45_004629, partial [Circinella minor]
MSSTPIIYREHRVIFGQERRKLTNQLKAGIKPRQIINVQSMDKPPVVAPPISVVESISAAVTSSYTCPPATPLLAPTHVPMLSAMPQQQIQSSNLILPKDLYNLQQKIRADDNKPTHPASIERARSFPDLVVIDTTYKVNHNGMPLVNIIGIDNLTADHYRECSLRSYYIGSAVVANEKTLSYVWVLQQLRDVVWTNESESKPRLFLTDDDGALTAALQLKFPDVPHVLCNWHIRNNFCKKVLQHVSKNGEKEEEQYKAIISAVDDMLWKRRTEEFDDAVKEYKAKALEACPDNEEGAADIIGYLNNTMLPYKQRWAGPWVESHKNFAARSTQRIEGFHSTLKTILESAGRMLHTFKSLHNCLHGFAQRAKVQQEYENLFSWVIKDNATPGDNRLHKQVGHLHVPVLKKPSIETIEEQVFEADDLEILNQYQEMKSNIVSAYMHCESNQQWKELIDSINSSLAKFSPPSIDKLLLPKSVKHKGRPKKSLGSRLPTGLEYAEDKAKEEQKKKKENDKQEQENEKKDDQKKKKKPLSPRSQPSDLYPNKRPKQKQLNLHPDIPPENTLERIEIVDDGWCGFPSLAYIIYKDQEKYIQVKEKMYEYVLQNADLCCTYICLGYDTIYNDLLKRMAYGVEPKLPEGTFCRRQYWLDAAQDLQVA